MSLIMESYFALWRNHTVRFRICEHYFVNGFGLVAGNTIEWNLHQSLSHPILRFLRVSVGKHRSQNPAV